MINIVLSFFLGSLISASCLWLGMKLTKIDGKFVAMLIIAAVSSLAGLIPTIGWLLSLIIMFVLICKWTDAEFWPDAVWMVIVANVVAIVGTAFLAGMATKLI